MENKPEHAINFYKDFEIIWDEDYDDRIYQAIDIILEKIEALKMSPEEIFSYDLRAIGEKKGTLTFYWWDNPHGRQLIDQLFPHGVIEINPDIWTIEHDCKDSQEFLEKVNEDFNLRKKKIFRVVTRSQRYAVLHRQKWICNYCQIALKYKETSPFGAKVAHIDHIHPFSERSSYHNGPENINELENLQALCPDCNFKKKTIKK